MMRSRKNVGYRRLNCYYGCCPETTKKLQKRIIKRKENIEWKKDLDKSYYSD